MTRVCEIGENFHMAKISAYTVTNLSKYVLCSRVTTGKSCSRCLLTVLLFMKAKQGQILYMYVCHWRHHQAMVQFTLAQLQQFKFKEQVHTSQMFPWTSSTTRLLPQANYISLDSQEALSLHEGSQFSVTRGNESRTRKLVYTMGILYGEKARWRTKQLSSSSRSYVSTSPVRRLLTERFAEVTLYQRNQHSF